MTKETVKEKLTSRIDMFVTATMKADLQQLALKNRRELSDYLRIEYENLIKKGKKK